MPALFSPLSLRSLTLRNRVGVSPMCQCSSDHGFATDWHFVHLGAFATGGAGLVLTEAAPVTPAGRISPQDLGIWDDAHIPTLRRLTDFCRAQGAVVGIQLAHAGRKASMRRPWKHSGGTVPLSEGGWDNVMAPSARPLASNHPSPDELSLDGIAHVVASFRATATMAAYSRTAFASPSKSPTACARCGRRSFRSSCASPLRIGSRAAGALKSRCSWPHGYMPAAST